ncbi:MAG TPA: MBL fold metallo-hydrolase [Intrasporangium sp.]|uniref:MBL fold metallo-hydrolase n=1 Tax=Intrasporangium sp. TaxID=1925024 RepID=UPI002D7A00AE|nr:MBL fold metallo-hydrolase [Intrasporangium sp.]HET7397163.1 MBL fold metallo-hydrolase [Intrasporangium sp.]
MRTFATSARPSTRATRATRAASAIVAATVSRAHARELLRAVHRMGAATHTIAPFVEHSPNFVDGRFHSAEPARRPRARVLVTALAGAIRARGRGRVVGTIPVVPARPPERPGALAVTWYGHATTVVEVDGVRFLLDPVFGGRASPSLHVGPRRMHPVPGDIEAIPTLDAVLISHDHYDHLDAPTIRALERRQRPRYIVPLGVDAHLLAWGVPASRITALDWRAHTEVSGIRVTCTEARHNSGRGFVDSQTLWAGWAVRGPQHSAYFAGDSGPSQRFAAIGADLGPFDLTILPVGAYDPLWPDIHLNPEEAVAVHQDVSPATAAERSVLLPVHWATFNLALHWWAEPIRRTRRAAEDAGVRVVCPRVGDRVDLSDGDLDAVAARFQDPWWDACCAEDDHD